jgi:hypothetical protein
MPFRVDLGDEILVAAEYDDEEQVGHQGEINQGHVFSCQHQQACNQP